MQRPSSQFLRLDREHLDLGDDLVEGEAGRVDRDGVGRGLEHRALGGAVAPVALVLGVEDLLRVAPVWAARRRARSSGEAVRKTLTAASGATTEPMSRPSATQSPCSMMACCLRTSAARTLGSAATRDAPADTSGVRIASVTSSPSSRTRSPTSIATAAATSPAGRPLRPAASATARYIAPVSRYVNPSRSATARATVDLPAPAGPSMAITMASEAR